MPRASRVQTWAYAVLLLLDTLLATLLGTAVAEVAAESGSSGSLNGGKVIRVGIDKPEGPSALSLLVAGFAFSLATFSYLLMFLILNQLSPDSPLVWIASRGVLDLSQCGAGALAQCSIAVGAGALLWICSVFILVMLGLVVIVKAVSHPGRQNWARSLSSLSRLGAKTHPKNHAEELASNRGSGIFVDDPFSEPEAVRPILSVDLVEGDDSLPPRNARHSTSSTHPYPAASGSGSGPRHSRSYHLVHTMGDFSPENKHNGCSASRSGLSRNLSSPSTGSISRPQQPEARPLLASTTTNYSNYSDHSLISSRSAPHGRASPAPVPPVPPMPQAVVDEKARVRQTVQDTVNEMLRQQQSQLTTPNGRGMPLRIETTPRVDVNPQEGAIVSAASDVFSVMADFAGSPRSPRTMINEYPPMALPVPSSLSRVAEMSHEATPRLPNGRGPESERPQWQERVPPHTPPIDESWSMGASRLPLPSLSSVGSSHQPQPSLGSSSGFHGTPQWEPSPPFRPGYERSVSASSGFPFPRVGVQDQRPSHSPPLAYPPADQGTLALDEATLFFHARSSPPQPPQVAPENEEATLFLNARTTPPPPPRAPPSEEEEASLFLGAKSSIPSPQPPAVAADEAEATLFFNGPKIPGLPRTGLPQPPAQEEEEEATLFFNSRPRIEAVAQDAEEATLFFNAPVITRPPATASTPVKNRPLPSPGSLPSASGSPERVLQPQPAEEEEATLFFPRR